MYRRSTLVLTIAALVSWWPLAVTVSSSADATEIKGLCPPPMEAALTELASKFDQSSGNKVEIEYAAGATIMDRVQKFGAADFAIMVGPQIDALQKQAKIAEGSRVDLARMGVGVIVPKGAPKPDISSVEAFKRSILSAKSLLHSDPARGAPAGSYIASLFEKLGIAAEVKLKTKLVGPGGPVFQSMPNHEAEIGLDNTPSILAATGVDLVGPLPREIQNITVYVGGVAASSSQQETARAFFAFFSSPLGKAALMANGFEPGS
jgi:molybdate transport system substrate-binding protein